jgi:hydroxyacylglutathione hydrolase
MVQKITTITHGGVNCYLVTLDKGFVLIDTGFSKNREDIENELESAGCKPGKLKLIILTHGDFDHSGNCAYFREKYETKIAMNEDDIGMVEKGDLFYNRNVNFLTKILGKLLLLFLRTSLKEDDRFTPDILLEDGYDLSLFGFDAHVIGIPGHSKGSVGVLTNTGELFCGDLLQNKSEPEKNSMIVNDEAFNKSVEKLEVLKINITYPGHGESFQMDLFMKKRLGVKY